MLNFQFEVFLSAHVITDTSESPFTWLEWSHPNLVTLDIIVLYWSFPLSESNCFPTNTIITLYFAENPISFSCHRTTVSSTDGGCIRVSAYWSVQQLVTSLGVRCWSQISFIYDRLIHHKFNQCPPQCHWIEPVRGLDQHLSGESCSELWEYLTVECSVALWFVYAWCMIWSVSFYPVSSQPKICQRE
jgi:hypothetical protein